MTCPPPLQRRKLLASDAFQRRFGFMYLRYEAPYFFWELVLMMRRIAFVVILLAVPTTMLQVG